jgi:ketosteroid isomerase-like protein
MSRIRTFLVALAASVLAATGQAADDAADIRAFLDAYDRAFVAKHLERLAAFYHPDVTIFEGGGVNRGWADYRDHHLGPELAEFEGLEFAHHDVTPNLLGPGGRVAYVTSEYHLKARVKGREVDATGLETLVLVRDDKGAWKIRHSHTSSRRRPPATPAPQK